MSLAVTRAQLAITTWPSQHIVMVNPFPVHLLRLGPVNCGSNLASALGVQKLLILHLLDRDEARADVGQNTVLQAWSLRYHNLSLPPVVVAQALIHFIYNLYRKWRTAE